MSSTQSMVPEREVSEVEVVFDKETKEGGWSVARLLVDGNEAIGIRWNVDTIKSGEELAHKEISSWFILPHEIAETVFRSAQALFQEDEAALRAGYEAMAADREHEAEAMEWIESHVGECM
jgi:hypothetical protein